MSGQLELGKGKNAADCVPAVQERGSHIAFPRMRFYTGDMFSSQYKKRIFIAKHGSWNRSENISCWLTMVKLKNKEPVSYTVFAQG